MGGGGHAGQCCQSVGSGGGSAAWCGVGLGGRWPARFWVRVVWAAGLHGEWVWALWVAGFGASVRCGCCGGLGSVGGWGRAHKRLQCCIRDGHLGGVGGWGPVTGVGDDQQHIGWV